MTYSINIITDKENINSKKYLLSLIPKIKLEITFDNYLFIFYTLIRKIELMDRKLWFCELFSKMLEGVGLPNDEEEFLYLVEIINKKAEIINKKKAGIKIFKENELRHQKRLRKEKNILNKKRLRKLKKKKIVNAKSKKKKIKYDSLKVDIKQNTVSTIYGSSGNHSKPIYNLPRS
jgi:hypothetical protein